MCTQADYNINYNSISSKFSNSLSIATTIICCVFFYGFTDPLYPAATTETPALLT